MTDHPSLSEQRALIERLRTRTFIPDADFARTPESVHELVFNLRKQGDEAADLLEAAFAQPPASGVDRSREAVARVHAKHWSGSPWWWDAAFDDSTDETAARLREDDLEAADAILDALTNSGAPVPGNGALREALEEIELLATNHGGWFEQDPFGEYAKLGNIATNALAHAAPAPSDEATGPVPAISAELLGEVMQDAWGEICDDTGCHPLDISRHKRSTWYSPRHWTDLIALRLNERLAKPEAGVPAGMVLVPVEPTRAWASTMANIRQGRSSTPRCEPPGEADIKWAHDRIADVLEAAKTLAAYTPKQATPTDEAVLGDRGARLIFGAVWERFCEGDFDLEVNDLITITALSCGIVKKVPFDPEEHIDVSGACEPGDDYYMLTEVGEKLISSAKAAPESPAPGSAGEASDA